MLVRTYVCTACGMHETIPDGREIPSCCEGPMRWRQTRDYKPEEHGWSTGMKAPAVGYRGTNPWVVPIEDAHGGQMEVSSLREIRKLEKESEQQERDGVGQAMRFRAFANNVAGGGMRDPLFGDPPHRKPQLFDAQGRQRISIEAVDGDDVECEMGPGAEEGLASALGGVD